MVKNDSLSTDLDFIKEFEELKLKQKLLIDSLNRKNGTQMNEFLVDINSKLDFLVKIFKETIEDKTSEEEKTAEDEKFNSILEKIDEKFNLVNGNIDAKFVEMQDQISLVKATISKNESVVPKIVNSINNLPPNPGFKAEIIDKHQIAPVASVPKKKKWF